MHKKLAQLLFLIGFLLISGASMAGAAKKLYVENIRYGSVNDGVRVVFDISDKVEYRAFVLDKPYRIVVDFPTMEWKHPKSGLLSNNRIIKGYRSGILDSGLTRVVFDIKEPAIIRNIFPLKKDAMNAERVVLDVERASVNRFLAEKDKVIGTKDINIASERVENKPTVTTPPKPETNYAIETKKKLEDTKPVMQTSELVNANIPQKKPQPVISPATSKPKAPEKHVVVIDAGHGGADPGAVYNGVMEKKVTLQVARELKKQLDETGRYKVVLTRDSDYYVKLGERRDVARESGADLFISIHADSIESKGVRGASLYTLSEKASDKEAARLAESENNSGFVAGVDLGHESQEVADILLDLAMREKMNESNLFANHLRGALFENNVNLLPNPSRSAGFAVLKAPDVPSILIEMGFLSNPQEAKLLTTANFQRKVARAILNGIDSYFRKIESLQK